MNLPLISDQVCNIRSTVALLVITHIDTVEPCYLEHLCDSIQLNSKTLFKDGDPVSSQFIFPGAIQTCEQ